jgi:hypothetical protein
MVRSIEACFDLLVKRIGRMTPGRFIELGFIPESWMVHYFPGLGRDECVEFDYLSVLTSEGANGVLHILYFGDYFPEKWLKTTWNEITGGAWIANISIVNVSCDDALAVTKYVVNQNHGRVFGYVAGQSKYVRHAYSSHWIYRGWRSDFDKLKSFCYVRSRYPEGDRRGYSHSIVSSDFWKEWFNWLTYRHLHYSVDMDIDFWIENVEFYHKE